MLGGFLFGCWRICQIITLIPVLGMLAWFVDIYNRQRQLTPTFILLLFVVSVLACTWAMATLLRLSSTRRSSRFVSFIDLCFVGALIASVYELRAIGRASCTNFFSNDIYINLGSLGSYGRDGGSTEGARGVNKNCAMLKASWAFAIMNIIFFLITSVLAFLLKSHDKESKERVVRKSRHGSRRGHSSSSHRRRSNSSRRYYV